MSDRDSRAISDFATLFGRFGIEAGFLIPTPTGMDKAIMDATWPLREYLSRTHFHDFNSQGQGGDAKRILPISVIQSGEVVEGKISLYRPETKQGDPRIWIYGLPKFADSGDLLALIVDSGRLLVVNCFKEDVEGLLTDESTLLGKIAARANAIVPTATELLEKLRNIGSMGYVQTLRSGDTGVGYTLETLLGIRANSSKDPDFKGIELKSGRLGKRRTPAPRSRTTLFSQIPDWKISPHNAQSALERFGYMDPKKNRLQLYCSVDTTVNSLGFKLDPRSAGDHLVTVNSKPNPEDVFMWCMDQLRRSFSEKHRETFWVRARAEGRSTEERFHYVQASHTRNPTLSTFERLLATGGICVDLTMSAKQSSKVRDHGYLFRVYGQSFNELFPEVASHSLV
jgi:hypothetical protein